MICAQINDLWDREIDAKVERTKNRPLASGAVTVPQAVTFLGAQLSVGLGVLLQLNEYSILLGASSLALVTTRFHRMVLASYTRHTRFARQVVTYPLMKRVTHWPQAFLGLTFNWGALLGWAAVHEACDWSVVLPLYGSGVCWTLFYDTIYAHQDKKDDVRAGVKSTALLLADDTKRWLTGFGGSTIALLTLSGLAAGQAAPFYVGVGAAASHLAWQLQSVNLDDPKDCLEKFKSNGWYGGIVFGGVVAGTLAGGGIPH